MKREIKFRGLTINGDIVFGMVTILKNDYSTVRKGCYISNSGGAPFAYMVRHETIGQYTGLKDKNGVEIYEGDIVSIMDFDYEIHETYSEDDPRWLEPLPIKEIRKDYVTLESFRYWLKNESFGYEGEDLISPENCIVIGNIHQNPELL